MITSAALIVSTLRRVLTRNIEFPNLFRFLISEGFAIDQAPRDNFIFQGLITLPSQSLRWKKTLRFFFFSFFSSKESHTQADFNDLNDRPSPEIIPSSFAELMNDDKIAERKRLGEQRSTKKGLLPLSLQNNHSIGTEGKV